MTDLPVLLDDALTPRLLGDLDELLGSMYVGGLAYPDPDLPTDLRALAERAASLGLATANGSLNTLAERLEALVAESGRSGRRDRANEVWDELQRLVCWQRIFRTEHAFMMVQARLGASGDAPVKREPPSFPTESRRVFPFGLELAGNRLVLWCRDLDNADSVVLVDELVERSDTDPIHTKAISRLFQDSVLLREVLSAVVVLHEHPVALKGGRRVFSPAYATRPTLQVVAVGYEPPRLPQIPLSGVGTPDFSGVVGAGRLVVVANRSSNRISLRTEQGISTGIAVSPTLRANLIKLLVRDQVESVALDAVVVHRRHGPVLLRVDDELEGACFPVQDPRLFRPTPTQLAANAGDSLAGLGLRAVLATDQDAALVGALDGFRPDDISARFAVEWARAAVTEPGLPAGLPLEISAALTAGQGGFGTLWLVSRFGLVEELEVQIRAFYRGFYAEFPPEPSISDLCCRALLSAWLEIEDIDPLKFLEAHLSALRLSALSHQSTLPDAAEICWLAETLSILTGDGRESGMGRSFDIPLDRIAEVVTEAMWRARTGRGGDSGAQALTDALWLARKTGTEAYFVA